jgi:hypothetical protein
MNLSLSHVRKVDALRHGYFVTVRSMEFAAWKWTKRVSRWELAVMGLEHVGLGILDLARVEG